MYEYPFIRFHSFNLLKAFPFKAARSMNRLCQLSAQPNVLLHLSPLSYRSPIFSRSRLDTWMDSWGFAWMDQRTTPPQNRWDNLWLVHPSREEGRYALKFAESAVLFSQGKRYLQVLHPSIYTLVKIDFCLQNVSFQQDFLPSFFRYIEAV